MHKYVIRLARYTEAGALTNDISYIFADTPQQLADKIKSYKAMRYTDENGADTGMKMYQVIPMQAVYQGIEDWDAFCAINAVLQ